MIHFDKKVCNDFNNAIKKEWLETNGLGGYASSTIIGVNTRGYHGLLVSATKPPLQRMLTLSKVEETVIIDGNRHEISCNQYPNAIYPDGYKYIDNFRLDPFPTFRFIIRNTIIEKSIFMIHGKNTVFITYKLLESDHDISIELRPLIACRDFHSRMHESYNPDIKVVSNAEAMNIEMNGIKLYILLRDGMFINQPCWYRNFEYAIEEERGQESHEDLYNPGYFIHDIKQDNEICLIASTNDPYKLDMEKSRSHELDRRTIFTENSLLENISESLQSCVSSLLSSADQFLVKRGEHQSVIAGYHWFGDWGRDSMISLAGLTLVTNKHDAAEKILLNYAKYCDQGMIPNYYSELGESLEYNSVDASLWFIYSAKKYLDYTDNLIFIESELFDTISEIIWHYINGTRYNTHNDSDGLLYAGENGKQLTWMDAKVGDFVVTPRIGKAVEINALWYNALKFMQELSERLDHKGSAEMYSGLAEKARKSFNEQFWNDEKKCLYDCIDGNQVDDSVRPNQIFSISLPYKVLDDKKRLFVLESVQKELLTPYGLRTLSPNDNRYIGIYRGDNFSRDKAYHQGTVWAWLLGPFIDAYISVHGKNKKTLDFIRNLICNFMQNHLADAGLGSISEIFDGDAPHNPRGCIAQAWSVAEILRAIVESGL